MKRKHTCPICGDGQFESLTEVVSLPYKDQEIKATSRMSLCGACGSEFVNAEDSRVNKRSVLAARKRFDGLLSGEEIYAIRKKYELNQKVAAQLFGGGPVAFSKYENDDVSHAESMDKLLRLVSGSVSAFWELVEQSGLTSEIKKPKLPLKDVSFLKSHHNVVLVNFGGNSFKPIEKSHSYASGNANAETFGELQWK
jgi:HTH-type transcriptional regulator/antitoxin MqsA